MGFEINNPFSVGGLYSNISIDRNRRNATNFGNTINSDTFESTSLKRFTTEAAIQKMITNNPKVKLITKNFNPNLELNMQELNELLEGHAKDTAEIAKGISENLPFSLQQKIDEKCIKDACYLHDLGKVLIPASILNKPDKLDDRETKIMHTHSELSYELLKNSGLNSKTLNLIRNHHQNIKKTGYPFVDKNFNADINLQIISMADKFSALTEKRTYKKPLSSKEALTIIYQDVKDGKIHPFVFRGLVNYAQTLEENTTQKVH